MGSQSAQVHFHLGPVGRRCRKPFSRRTQRGWRLDLSWIIFSSIWLKSWIPGWSRFSFSFWASFVSLKYTHSSLFIFFPQAEHSCHLLKSLNLWTWGWALFHRGANSNVVFANDKCTTLLSALFTHRAVMCVKTALNLHRKMIHCCKCRHKHLPSLFAQNLPKTVAFSEKLNR